MNPVSEPESLQSLLPILLLKHVVAAVVLACGCLAFFVAQNEREFLLAILGTMCLVVVSVPLFVNRWTNVFEPITFVVLLVIIGIPVKLIYVLWIRKTDPFVADFVLLNQDPEIFLDGVFLTLGALILFVAGYMLRFPRAPLELIYFPRINEWNGRRLQLAILVIGTVSLLSFLAFVVAAGVNFSSFSSISQKRFLEVRAEGGERMHSSMYLLCRGAAFSKFVVYFCFVWILHRGKSFFSLTGLVLLIAVLQSILLAVILNSRAGVALLLLDCSILSYFLLRRVDFKLIGVCFAVAGMLMLPMLAARVKNVNRNVDASAVSLEKLVQKTLCGRNMLDIAKICHIVNGVPSKMAFRNGEMLYAWLAAPIPVSVWPEKPVWANQGLTLNQKIFGYRGSVSGCPPGLLGELYWNFGVPGVLIGMFLAGLVYRQIYVSFVPHRHVPTSILLYTMIFTRFFLFSLGNDLGTGIVKAGLDLVPVYLTLFFIGRYHPQTQATAVAAATQSPPASQPLVQVP